MTNMRKICPSSGEKCDCPKGICNAAIEKLVVGLATSAQGDYWNGVNETPANATQRFECPSCKAKGFEPSLLPNRCTFCDGTFSGNPPTAEEVYDARTPDEQDRIDKQEAGSLKYALCAQILLLSSGKFALFGAYSAADGIPLLAIDTWENLEPHVRAYRKTAEEGYAREKLNEEQRRNLHAAKAAADYDSLFGESE